MYINTVETEDEVYDRKYRRGDREIRLVDQYEEGIQVKVVVRMPDYRDAELLGRELVSVPDGRVLVFRPSNNTPAVRNARIFGKLYQKVEDIGIRGDADLIPTKVAIMGKPAIASYLHVVHGLRRREIAERLDVQPKTVQQYWHRIYDESAKEEEDWIEDAQTTLREF